MFCGRCGEKLSDDSKFCSKCGLKIEVKSSLNEKALVKKGKKTGSILKLSLAGVGILGLLIAILLIDKLLFSGENNSVSAKSDSEQQRGYFLEEEYDTYTQPIDEVIENSELGIDEEVSDENSTIKVLEEMYVKRINYYSSDNECTSYIIPEYADTREVGGKKYSSNGQETNSYKYEYDEMGNLIKEIWLNPDGEIYYYNEYEYDELGNKLRGRHYGNSGEMYYFYEYQYDEKGNCILEVRYDQYGTKQIHFINEFDEQNRKIKSTLYNDYSNNKTHWIEYEYDAWGNCINEIWYEINGTFMERIEKQYEGIV